MEYSLGIDIGGTAIKLGVLDLSTNRVVYKHSFPTRSADGSDAIMSDIRIESEKAEKLFHISHVGVGCPGDKDDSNTCILEAGNLPFRNLRIVDEIKKSFDCEVFLDNDGNCALISEWICGCGMGCRDMITVTIGTGIGGGCIVNGDILRGTHNDGGELGHFVIDDNGPECNCGQSGCFECFASARALVASATRAAKENPDSVLASLARDGVNGTTVFEAFRRGCPVAAAVLDRYGKRLATGINGLNYIFAPEVIALAGGIVKEGDDLLRFVRPYLLHPDLVKASTLGGDAGIIGAALLYRFSDYYMSLRNIDGKDCE